MKQPVIHPDNAIILAAGFASRLAPLSLHTPKALLKVRGEILIERQIRQLQQAGIHEIVIVTGYKQEQFAYLSELPGVCIVVNEQYQTRNNHSSIWAARNFIGNSYICSSDNYFTKNVFTDIVSTPYYAALYSHGPTEEYCMTTDSHGRITDVTIGGQNSWYMLGHVFWDHTFSNLFMKILEQEYDLPQTAKKLWESLYIEHIHELTLYLKKYNDQVIYEFDSLEDLIHFDPTYEHYDH